jgi:fatty-acyl-CoA synthase
MQPALNLPSVLAFEDDDTSGDRPALRLRIGPKHTHADLTYRDLRVACVSVAASLAGLGCRQGERIALLMPASGRLVTTFFGALYGGFVPSILAWPTTKMDPEKYRRNVAAVVGSLGADWLVTDAVTVRQLDGAVGRAQVIDPSVASAEAFGLDGGSHSRPTAVPPSPRSEGTAFIQFSGGTTGVQKSVPISLDLLSRQLEGYAGALRLCESDGIASWLPLYHDMGLVACLLLPFAFRLPVTMFSPIEWVMDPRPFLQAIGADRATLCWLPNFAFAFMAAKVSAPAGAFDLSPLRAAINCSEPVRADSMDAFFTRFRSDGLRREALHTCYAMAEATFAVSQSTDADPPRRLIVCPEALGQGRLEPRASGRTLVSSGPPIPGMEVSIAGPDGTPSPPGQIGEIRLRGLSVMDDYLTPSDAGAAETRRAFAGDFYRTGDRGALVDGHVYVTGRQKDLIIIGGVNLHPEDLEAAVSGVEGIHPGRVIALGLDDERLGTERLVVVAEANEPRDLARSPAIEADARRAVLAVSGVAPSKVFVVPPQWIVKSTAGKPARAETKARLLARWDDLLAAAELRPAPTEGPQ